MSCPEGQFFSDSAKRCLPNKMKALSKGHSLVPCPVGQVWNPDPSVRKCVRKDIYKLMFGAEKAAAASLEQKRLRGSIGKKQASIGKKAASIGKKAASIGKKQASIGKKPVSIKKRKRVSIKKKTLKAASLSPSLKESVKLVSLEPRKDSFMAPGLTRKEMAAWVSAHCKNQEDPIMMEPYAEAELKDLSSLVRLGSGFCYTAEVLDQHVRASLERDVPVKDMLNPSYRLDGHDYGALAKASSKGYELPKEIAIKPPSHYKLFIGVADDPLYKLIFLFDERRVKVNANGDKEFTDAIPDGGWIGYIPASRTEKLEKLIVEAFARGKIFTKSSRPFKCCRVHLKKNKAHWNDGVLRKIKALEEELLGVL